MSLPEEKIRDHCGPYFRSAEQHLDIAALVHEKGYFPLFCYLVTTSAEMTGAGLLMLNGVEHSNDDIRHKYGHSIKGIYGKLCELEHITEDEADAIYIALADMTFEPKPDSGKKYEKDHGANVFKFPYAKFNRGWPEEWVDEKYAEPIMKTTVPILRKILDRV